MKSAESTASAALAGETRLDPDHPMLPGHFPGRPLAPGAWVLAALLDGLYAATGTPHTVPVALGRTRFTRALVPGERLAWTWALAGPGRYKGVGRQPDGAAVVETDARLGPGPVAEDAAP